jgi:hypothetical protein
VVTIHEANHPDARDTTTYHQCVVQALSKEKAKQQAKSIFLTEKKSEESDGSSDAESDEDGDDGGHVEFMEAQTIADFVKSRMNQCVQISDWLHWMYVIDFWLIALDVCHCHSIFC